MGVIRERKVVCVSTKNVPSNPESTVQSGYTTQESEDEGSSQVDSPARRPRTRQRLIADGSLNLAFNRLITNHTGQRKARRILNTRFLETLVEDPEITLEIDTKSKFRVLMEETEDALEFLEAYEREQAENALNGNQDTLEVEFEGDVDPYWRIPRKIRAAIDSRKNFQYELLKSIEMELTSQLQDEGGDNVYTYTPSTCYERLLVHAVAIFKGFLSETIAEGDIKLVKVSKNTAISPTCNTQDICNTLLCDYILCLRSEE